MPSLGEAEWTGRGKVRAREIAGGAEIAIEGGYVIARARHGLKGARIAFDKVSVGASG